MDMQQQKWCEPEDMIRFLLAICCQGDSSTTPVSRDEILETRFQSCLEKATEIANCSELEEKLKG
jgi:hypothetical protein